MLGNSRPARAWALPIALLALVCTALTAIAAWSASGVGSAQANALTMPAGNVPTAVASGTSVTVNWAASTFSNGAAVGGYLVHRYDTGGTVQTVGAACAGTITATTCAENSVPMGSWQYTVTPVDNSWTGAESGKSAIASINAWATVASMPTARDSLAAVGGSDGRIYAIGGFNGNGNGNTVLNTVEAYTSSSNSWSTVASMPTARYGLAAVAGADDRIYAIGGYNGNTFLHTVEAYTPSSNSWSAVASMPTARFSLAAVAGADGRIYAIGGYNSGYVNTVEAYSPSSNTWATVAGMPTARGSLAAAGGSDGRIYAVGGANGYGYLTTVEALTP